MGDLRLSTKFQGYDVEYVDFYKYFRISLDGNVLKSEMPTLEKCEAWIKQQLKARFKRVPVLAKVGWGGGGVRKAEATSLVDDEHVWVVAGKDRGKCFISQVWLDNKENHHRLTLIREKEKEIKKLEGDIKNLQGNMDLLKPEMMEEIEK